MSVDISYFERWKEAQLRDPEARAEYERELEAIRAVDRETREVLKTIEERREELHISKAELARLIDKHPVVVRRMLNSPASRPEMPTVLAMIHALGGRISVEFTDIHEHREERRAVAAGR